MVNVTSPHHCIGCDPGETCFGLQHWEIVPFWCIVLLLTLGYYALKHTQERMRVSDTVDCPPWWPLQLWSSLFGVQVKPSDVEIGLLKDSNDSGQQDSTLHISPEQMSSVCKEHGVTGDLKSAALAVLITLQHRRTFGSSTISIASPTGGEMRNLELELEMPSMPFARLLKSVDESLSRMKNNPDAYVVSDAPEVVFAWGQAASKAGQWSIRFAGAFLEVRAGTSDDAAAFHAIFDACAADPNIDVWAAPAMTEASLRQIQAWSTGARDLTNWRVGKVSDGAMRPVIELLKEAPAAPGQAAVVGDGFAISHEELWRRANAIANVVQRHTSEATSKFVIFYMGRGESIAPSYFGVLQAGFQVVPVDVHWPADRIQMVVTDTEVALVLTDASSYAAWLGMDIQTLCPVLKVEKDLIEEHASCVTVHLPKLTADSPAVVLFTSGSTGRPKGIVLSHGYITTLTADIAEFKDMNQNTKVVTASSPTWMPFLDALIAPLLKGGCCVLFPEGATHVVKPNDLSMFARKTGATHCGFVPAMLDIFVEQGLPPTLAHIGVGGAPTPAELAARVLEALPHGGKLHTSYSGTEQGQPTVATCRGVEDVHAHTIDGKNVLDAGKAHGAQRIAILDPQMRPTGPGAVGEICVSGPGLCSGYLGLPEKNAETFLPCDFFGGARTARTSDLGQWTEQGHLKVVGRKDSMVKVRGARIELGEVEAAVGSHPAVRSCVVVVNQDRLVAYVSPAVPGDLREHCKAKLVAYMVPHIFEGLEELPRLANGKINKKALPEPTDKAEGAETVMELDSLGQMRKFTRRSAAEDRVLDNVRAILIGVVIQSHPIPLLPDSFTMLSANWDNLHAEWGPVQHGILWLLRSGGWSSLAFLSGFDDTRSERPFGLTYREPIFLLLWFLCGFNWTMWYLPAFVIMRASFCAAHHVGLMKTYLVLASQIFLTMPAFVDLYTGWQPRDYSDGNPAGCFAPFQAIPWAQTVAYHTLGMWNMGVSNSFFGIALIFIPCYWLGFYLGPRIFPVLSRLADEPRWLKRIMIAIFVFLLYVGMSQVESVAKKQYDDRCSSYWAGGNFHLEHVIKNVLYWCLNLWQSLMYVVFISAVVPFHLKYLAKVCFPALLFSPFAECLMDFSKQAMQIRRHIPAVVSPGAEMAWILTIPFLFELVAGAGFATILPPIARGTTAIVKAVKASF